MQPSHVEFEHVLQGQLYCKANYENNLNSRRLIEIYTTGMA
jgi:hypothetical protein